MVYLSVGVCVCYAYEPMYLRVCMHLFYPVKQCNYFFCVEIHWVIGWPCQLILGCDWMVYTVLHTHDDRITMSMKFYWM